MLPLAVRRLNIQIFVMRINDALSGMSQVSSAQTGMNNYREMKDENAPVPARPEVGYKQTKTG